MVPSVFGILSEYLGTLKALAWWEQFLQLNVKFSTCYSDGFGHLQLIVGSPRLGHPVVDSIDLQIVQVNLR